MTGQRGDAQWKSQVRKYDLTDPPSEQTQRLAGIFVTLQRRRHAADYFPPPGEPVAVDQTHALQKVKDARRFCQLVQECCSGREPDATFVALVSEMLRASVKGPRRSSRVLFRHLLVELDIMPYRHRGPATLPGDRGQVVCVGDRHVLGCQDQGERGAWASFNGHSVYQRSVGIVVDCDLQFAITEKCC